MNNLTRTAKTRLLALIIASAAAVSQAAFVLMTQGFETGTPGSSINQDGWSYGSIPGGGTSPKYSTNNPDEGAQSLEWTQRYTAWVYSPSVFVGDAKAGVTLKFKVAQRNGINYSADQGLDWQRDYFRLSVSMDGGAHTTILNDYALLNGFTGQYTGSQIENANDSGTADGSYAAYEIHLDTEGVSTLVFGFKGSTAQADNQHDYFLDTVEVSGEVAPEPSSLGLLLVGAAMIHPLRKYRKMTRRA